MSLGKPPKGRSQAERRFTLLLYLDNPRDRAIIAYLQQLNRRERQTEIKRLLFEAIGERLTEENLSAADPRVALAYDDAEPAIGLDDDDDAFTL